MQAFQDGNDNSLPKKSGQAVPVGVVWLSGGANVAWKVYLSLFFVWGFVRDIGDGMWPAPKSVIVDLFIDISPVTYCQNKNSKNIIIDIIDDPVIANAYPVSWSSF